jgi:ABC-type amino acid transport substrate-binding protein
LIVRNASSAVIDKDEDYYFYRLLLLAVAKTQEDWGKLEVTELPYLLEDRRLRTSLSQGVVDVIWSPTSHEYEQRMLPVRISLLKDLNNYRLLLIRKGDQHKFTAIENLDDLAKLRGGISPQWTDAKIMEYNNLPLVKAVGYQKLFRMLAANRFDYFSRGVYQIHAEIKMYGHLWLEVEQELMLSYPNEVYFFVNKNNPRLAKRIETGLVRALADGSFDELLMSVPSYKLGSELLKNHRRRVIVLKSLPEGQNN